MKKRLKCHPRFDLGNRRGLSRHIYVVDENGENVSSLDLMCSCLDSDVQNPEGSGACFLDWVGRVERGELESVGIDGNAWMAHVDRDKVWFEGLFNQGEGGEVTLNQFKFALNTYLRFLSDPAHKPIEVDFPPH